MNRKELAGTALKSALSLRRDFDIGLDSSFCVMDLAAALGLEVKYVDLDSLEGVYLKEAATVMLSTHRSDGRMRFTCAHELGHFSYGHGDSFEELAESAATCSRKHDNEYTCDIFAQYLLMPKATVNSGFISRGIDTRNIQPNDVYRVATWLGVGYSSLVYHLLYGLHMITENQFSTLVKIQPKTIKHKYGVNSKSNLILIDRFWNGRPVDLEVGDTLHSQETMIQDLQLCTPQENNFWQATTVGETTACLAPSDHKLRIRVREKAFVGRAIFRHLGED